MIYQQKPLISLTLFLVLSLSMVRQTFALTEIEFINKFLSQDTHFEKDQIYVDIKQLELDASRDSYTGWNPDLTIELDNSYYDIDKDTTSTSIYEKKRRKNQQSVEVSAEKKFLSNPSSLSISASRSTPDEDKWRYKQDDYYDEYNISTYDNNYKLTYTYPLLKHDSNASSLKSYRRNIWDLEREKLDFYDAQEAFLVDRLERYLLWALYDKNAQIYADYLQALKSIELVKEADKNKLEIAIFRANKSILDNDAKLQAQIQALVIDLNDENLLSLKPQVDYAKSSKIIDKDLDAYLKQNIRSLLKDEIDKNLKRIDIDYYNNQNLMQLDLSLSAEKDANIGNTKTTTYDNSSVNYSSNITLNIPLGGSVNDKKNLTVAQMNLRKLQIDTNNALKDVKSDILALNTKLVLIEKTLSGYANIVADAKKEAQIQHENYNLQSTTINNLLDAYQDRRDVELEYISQVINYHENILAYDDKLDRLIGFVN